MARYGYKLADVTHRLMKKSRTAILPRNRDLYSAAVGLLCEFKERAERAEKECERLKRNPVVLCKNCRYYRREDEVCGFWKSCRHPDHYCGEGERRCNVDNGR